MSSPATRRDRGRPSPSRRGAGRRAIDLAPYVATHGDRRRGAAASASSLQQFLGVANIALVFLTGGAGLGGALTACCLRSIACLVSVLAYNFFFLPPLYTFTIADPENVVALFFFLIVAVIASNLAARMRSQVVTARGRAPHHRGALRLQPQARRHRQRSTICSGPPVYQIALDAEGARRAAAARGRRSIAVRAGYPPEDELDEADLAAAKWTWEHNRAAGRGADTLPGAKRLFLPLAHRPRRRRRASASTATSRARC